MKRPFALHGRARPDGRARPCSRLGRGLRPLHPRPPGSCALMHARPGAQAEGALPPLHSPTMRGRASPHGEALPRPTPAHEAFPINPPLPPARPFPLVSFTRSVVWLEEKRCLPGDSTVAARGRAGRVGGGWSEGPSAGGAPGAKGAAPERGPLRAIPSFCFTEEQLVRPRGSQRALPPPRSRQRQAA